jgi:ABC-type spermidine/putrescine transport system permease subunit I
MRYLLPTFLLLITSFVGFTTQQYKSTEKTCWIKHYDRVLNDFVYCKLTCEEAKKIIKKFKNSAELINQK